MQDVTFEHRVVTARPASLTLASPNRRLPAVMRRGLLAGFALASGVLIGASLPEAARLLGAEAAAAPGKLAWDVARVTGFLAYIAFSASVVVGLLLSSKLLDAIAHRPVSFHLHQDFALAGIGLSGLHGLLLLGDGTFAFTPAAIAIPFASPYAPFAVGAGQLAFYVLAVVAASFQVRGRIGQRAWRSIHYLTFLAFVGVTAHGIAAGSDSAAPWARWLYLAPVTVAAFLVTYRLSVAAARRAHSSVAAGILLATGDRQFHE